MNAPVTCLPAANRRLRYSDGRRQGTSREALPLTQSPQLRACQLDHPKGKVSKQRILIPIPTVSPCEPKIKRPIPVATLMFPGVGQIYHGLSQGLVSLGRNYQGADGDFVATPETCSVRSR